MERHLLPIWQWLRISGKRSIPRKLFSFKVLLILASPTFRSNWTVWSFRIDVLIFFEDFGTEMTKDSLCTSTIKHIGTIAADLFEGKILIIDYKNQRLCGIESLPSDWEQRVEFVDIEYVKESNLVFLPLQIGDITYRVMFDTGSSIFPLLSSLSKIARISNPDRCVDSLTVLSWGKPVDVYGYIPDVKIMLGKEELDNSLPVYGSDMLNDKNLDRSGYWGLTGNRYFLDKTIVIDYKNRRFGILKE